MTLSISNSASRTNPSKPCHNCRRRRLRCDRSLPGCHKCSSRREECLGYGQLLRWTNTIAVGDKLRGPVIHHEPYKQCSESGNFLDIPANSGYATSNTVEDWSVKFSLVDPILQDFGHRHRCYINHCEFKTVALTLRVCSKSFL